MNELDQTTLETGVMDPDEAVAVPQDIEAEQVLLGMVLVDNQWTKS